MDKKTALKIILDCAEKYKNNFLNKNVLFICSSNSGQIMFMEAAFLSQNFRHMTGVKFEKDKELEPKVFYDLAVSKRLSTKQILMNPDGTTELKLTVLPMLLDSNMSARMIGDYNSYNPKLVTEKLVGGIRGCMGFVLDQDIGFYAPNTVLNMDMRDYITNQRRILAIFKKNINDCNYEELVYMAKSSKPVHIPKPFEYLNSYFN